MPLVLLAVEAFVIGVSVIAMHNSVSNQSSASAVSEALENMEEEKEELDRKIKTQLLLGMVTIVIKIVNWKEGRSEAQRERINAIENASGGAATAIGINIAQDVIEAIKGRSDAVALNPDASPMIPPFDPPAIPGDDPIPPFIPPVIPNEGVISNPLNPPNVGPIDAPPFIPPDEGPTNPPPLIPPVVASKGLEDIIRMAYDNLPNNGVWPGGNPGKGEIGKFKDELDKLFGVEGKWELDGSTTKGRKQVKWVFPDGTEVIWERHPYDKKNGAPSTHTEAHYHVNQNGQHGPGFKGKD